MQIDSIRAGVGNGIIILYKIAVKLKILFIGIKIPRSKLIPGAWK